MLHSTMCLVPEGDSPTSRRLFDALASGCVPVVFCDAPRIARNLPFKTVVEWPSVAVFAGPLPCVGKRKDVAAATVAWVNDFMLNNTRVVKCMAKKGQDQFRKALAYERGAVVGALMNELRMTRAWPSGLLMDMPVSGFGAGAALEQ